MLYSNGSVPVGSKPHVGGEHGFLHPNVVGIDRNMVDSKNTDIQYDMSVLQISPCDLAEMPTFCCFLLIQTSQSHPQASHLARHRLAAQEIRQGLRNVLTKNGWTQGPIWRRSWDMKKVAHKLGSSTWVCLKMLGIFPMK